MTKHPRELSDKEAERWQDSQQPRFGEPMDYLPPRTIDTMPCRYTHGDRHDIVVFAASGSLDEIGMWYTQQLPIHIYEESEYDPGQLTLYSLYDKSSRAYSVILADSEFEEATAMFCSYVGSEYLERMIAHRPCVIGALYLEEIGWAARNPGAP